MIGGQNLFKWCRSHDQDCHHAHIWLNSLKYFFSGTKWRKWWPLNDHQFFYRKVRFACRKKAWKLNSSGLGLRWALQDHWPTGVSFFLFPFSVFLGLWSEAESCLSDSLPNYCQNSVNVLIQQKLYSFSTDGFDVAQFSQCHGKSD